jgi:DsbC/DsbD-like thiol-disulfide interchange protein
VALGLLLAGADASRAEDVSAWDSDQHSAVRLIVGSIGNGMLTLRAGIEVRIDQGWKTYWRYAGDSGLPPTFEFTGSENVKSVTVKWPVPRRFPDGAGGHSIGYTGKVIFPVEVAAQNPGRPVTLQLKASYGVCEKICIPAIGQAKLQLASGKSSQDTALIDAEMRVPKPAALGAPGPLTVRAVRRDASGSRERVMVDVTAPEAAEVDLFAEGPTSEWALPLPELLEKGANGARRFAFAIDGLPPGGKIAGAPIRLTLTAGESAIEVTTRID